MRTEEIDVDLRPEDRCVHFLALEAEDPGFEVEWLSRTPFDLPEVPLE